MTNAHMAHARAILAAKERERRFREAASFIFASAFLLTMALLSFSWSLGN